MTSKLGQKGDTVVVKAGFMRNCLTKKGLAVYATPYHRERILNNINNDHNDNNNNDDDSSSSNDANNQVA